MSDYTTFLVARPSFAEGVARLIDVGGTLTEFNRSHTPQQADRIAMRMDWLAVGDFLRWAVANYEDTYPELAKQFPSLYDRYRK